MQFIVLSVLPDREFTVDVLTGDPVKTLERWRYRRQEKGSTLKLPVAAFRFDGDVTAFEAAAGLRVNRPADRRRVKYPLSELPGRWRFMPLEEPWRTPVQRFATQCEGAAGLLAQLITE